MKSITTQQLTPGGHTGGLADYGKQSFENFSLALLEKSMLEVMYIVESLNGNLVGCDHSSKLIFDFLQKKFNYPTFVVFFGVLMRFFDVKCLLVVFPSVIQISI